MGVLVSLGERLVEGLRDEVVIEIGGAHVAAQLVRGTPRRRRRIVDRTSRADRYTAQSLGYALVGCVFIQAAIAFKSTTAKGPSGALIELAETTWGKALLWIIAIGLSAYGVFCIAEAKYRKAAWSSPEQRLIAESF